MAVADDGERYRAPALDKGLDILELLSTCDEALSQVEIAKALHRSANEIYRMLDRLVRREYVRRTSTDRYELTLKLFELAHARPPVNRLVSQALPVMRRFARSAGQACHLGLLDGDSVIVIAQVDAPISWNPSLRVGSRIPLAGTASGHVHLAFSGPEERSIAAGARGTRGTGLEERLAGVRLRGYECLPSAIVEGVTNISAPIIGPLGGIMASFTCPFVRRIDSPDVPDRDGVIEILVAAARELSRRDLRTDQP